MEDYRIVKRLFVAASSPIITNVCLSKTAQLHQEESDAEVEKTVKRSMHVDDMMK